MSEKNTHNRMTARMDQWCASVRDVGGKVEVSRGDLFILVNLAQMGIRSVLLHTVTNDAMFEEALKQRTAELNRIGKVLTLAGQGDARGNLIYLAAFGCSIIENRFSDLAIGPGDEADAKEEDDT